MEEDILSQIKSSNAKKQVRGNDGKFVPKEDVILRFFLSASSCGQVFFRLYYQRPELKPFASKEGYYINFSQSVQLDGTTLYLWGSNEKAHRRVVAYNCGGESAAENYKTQVLSTLVEYVNSMREVPISFPLYNQCDIYEL